MAGYMKKLNGHVYDGMHVAAADGLTNGTFVELDANGKVIPTAAARDTIMVVRELTALWGMDAVVLDVISHGTDEVYFVENEWEVYEDAGEYNTAEYSVKADHFVKMHAPLRGEQLIMTVENALYTTLAIGDKVQPAAAGTIVKV